MSAQTTVAEYSAVPWPVKAVSVMPDFRLAVTFQDGLSGVVDCSRVVDAANPGVFAALSAPEFFAQASLHLGRLRGPTVRTMIRSGCMKASRAKKRGLPPFDLPF